MSVSDRCRTLLRSLESMIRDDHIKSDIIKHTCSDILLIDGKRPTLLEEVELLDCLIGYLSQKCEDDTKIRIFSEIFPFDKDISQDRLLFLTKLTSLAVYLGHIPILDLIGIWLKLRVSSLYAAATYPPSNQTVSNMYRTIVTYVSNAVTDLLSIPGLPCGPVCLNGSVKSEEGDGEHPLMTLPNQSAAFVDALLSGITIVYGTSPTLASLILNRDHTELDPVGAPPSALVHCLVAWLQMARIHPRSHHASPSSSGWTSVEWSNLLRRHKLHTQIQSTPDPIFLHCPPAPIGLAWWTVFWPLHSDSGSSSLPNSRRDSDDKLLNLHIAQLHYELLQCLLDTGGPGSAGHRHGGGGTGGSSGSSAFLNWSITCSRKLERTREFAYLELLVQHAQTCCSRPTADNADTDDQLCGGRELMLIRLAEFMQLAWTSGRIRNLSSDEFAKLLAPLAGNKPIDLVRARFKRS